MPKKSLETSSSLSAGETADHLAKSLGGTPSHWKVWLANDRKPGRVNRRLPVQQGFGRPRYDGNVVDAFVQESVSNNDSHGVVRAAPKEREFKPHISAVSSLENDGTPFVLLVTISPLASYKLTAAQARQIASRLLNAATAIEEEA